MEKRLQELRNRFQNNPEVREMIARRAYEIYEQRGCVQGYDVEDWVQAEGEILGRLVEAKSKQRSSSSRGTSLKPRANQASKAAAGKPAKKVVAKREAAMATSPEPAQSSPGMGAAEGSKKKGAPRQVRAQSSRLSPAAKPEEHTAAVLESSTPTEPLSEPSAPDSAPRARKGKSSRRPSQKPPTDVV